MRDQRPQNCTEGRVKKLHVKLRSTNHNKSKQSQILKRPGPVTNIPRQMTVSPVLSATSVLGAGNVNPLVLHFSGASAASESEYEPTIKHVASSSRQPVIKPVIVNGQLLRNPKRIYKCTFDSCDKSYAKPSRLEEHERSHTGDVGQIDLAHTSASTI